MINSDIYANKEFLKQIESAQKIASMVNTPAINGALSVVNSPVVQQAYESLGAVNSVLESIKPVCAQVSILSEFANNNLKGILSNSIEYYTSLAQIATDAVQSFSYEQLSVFDALKDYKFVHYHPDNATDEEAIENEKINTKIVTEIFKSEKEIDDISNKKESAIITLSPVSDRLLKYLSENPEAFYQLKSRKFEEVMAEIYNKLGYNVELTKATRDGGKDIIIRKPEILGDFIYYVECKKYAADDPVGVGIVRAFDGVINMNRVNGGIIATTSYFAKDARDLILDKNLSYQIQMHDYNKIGEMLNQVV